MTNTTQHTPTPWHNGAEPSKWVFVDDGRVKPINAGNIPTAQRIIADHNDADKWALISAEQTRAIAELAAALRDTLAYLDLKYEGYMVEYANCLETHAIPFSCNRHRKQIRAALAKVTK